MISAIQPHPLRLAKRTSCYARRISSSDRGDPVDDVQHPADHQQHGRKQGPTQAPDLIHRQLLLPPLRSPARASGRRTCQLERRTGSTIAA